MQTVLDMLNVNKTDPELDLTKGLSTYSYPDMRRKDYDLAQTSKQFIESINKSIVGKNFSECTVINQALYKALMGKQKVMLGDMSEILYRRILGNSLTLDETKDIFRFLTDKLKRLEEPISYREAAHNFLPHIFQLPKDLYMTAMLKEAFQAATSVTAFVAAHHYVPIQKYWVDAPYGVNFTQATRVPERITGEKDEELVEKHALLDSLLEKRAWGQGHVINPFCYLVEDIASLSDRDIGALKECFQFHYRKYEKFKQLNAAIGIPTYESRRVALMENAAGKRDEQLRLKIEAQQASYELQQDLSDLDKLKLTYWQQTTANNQRLGQLPGRVAPRSNE